MQNYTEEEKYWIWLSYVPDIAPKLFYHIMKDFGDAQSFFDAVKNDSALLESLPAKFVCSAKEASTEQRAAEIIAELNARGIFALTRLLDEYPQMLTQIPYPPPVLFCKGSIDGVFVSNNSIGCISIVGTRRCTRKGAELARSIARDLSAAGVTIVSGMARGIDTAAHTGALDAGGKTVAVLGCGADVIYPPESEQIYYKTIENGAVISELPAGTQPLAENFPVRNRIIAGLSKGTLIVESEERGGTAITASMAISFGRDVFAVPAGPYLHMAALPDMLISNGALPVTCAADILKFYGLGNDKDTGIAAAQQIQLDFLQRQIYNLLLQGDTSVENIAGGIEYPQSEINSALTMMELGGLIKRTPGGKYGI